MKTKFKFFFLLILILAGLRGQSQCQAYFSYYATPGGVVYFYGHISSNDSSVGPVISFNWNFGDGNNLMTMDSVPTHTYASGGAYIVCVTVTDSTNGCQASACDTIYVNLCAGASDFNAVETGFGEYNFTASDVQNLSGATVLWNFGDGSTSSSLNPTHQYTANGSYQICLVVSDATYGCIDSSCNYYYFSICNDYWEPIDTSIRSSIPLQVFVQPASVHSTYNYAWNFGDGGTSNADTLTYTYYTSGTYNITLLTTDPTTGCTASAFIKVYSEHCGIPYDGFLISWTSTLNPSFTAEVFYLDSPYVYQYGLLWSFPGGTSSADTGLSVNVTYPQYGTYSVCLTMSTSSGCKDTVCQSITIGPPPPPLYSINGRIDSAMGGTCGIVYLIVEDTIGHLTLIDSIINGLDSAGVCGNFYYNFTNLPVGSYYLKAALEPNDPNYANYLPTYYGEVLHWADAFAIPLGLDSLSLDINLLAGVNPGGPGFIGGWVSQGAGLSAHGSGGHNTEQSVGGPLAGIQINLLNESDVPVSYAYTDNSGHYQFANLQYGTYKLYAEELNKVVVPLIITISGEVPTDSNANISINSSTATSIDEVNGLGIISVYPNPVTSSLQVRLKTDQNASGSLKLLDVLGQTAFEQQINFVNGENAEEIDMQKMPAGVYELVIATAHKQITYKIVKTQ